MPLRARQWLWVALGVYALFGALHGAHAGLGRAMPRVLDLLSLLAMLPLAWCWMRADARERAQPQTPAMGGLVIGLSWLGVAWYLWRNRPAGQRVRAVGWALGFGLLALPLTYVVAGAPLAWLLGGW